MSKVDYVALRQQLRALTTMVGIQRAQCEPHEHVLVKHNAEHWAAVTDISQAMWPEERGTMDGLLKLNTRSGVHTYPWLTADECRKLLEVVDTQEYSVNEDEPELARMQEVVLEDFPELEPLYNHLWNRFVDELYGLIAVTTGVLIESISSIQVAKYDAKGISRGVWHSDADSDLTVTVALNDDFTGGGFELIGPNHLLDGVTKVEPVPIGYATVFKGRTCLHRGLPIQEGTRAILVFWCKVSDTYGG